MNKPTPLSPTVLKAICGRVVAAVPMEVAYLPTAFGKRKEKRPSKKRLHTGVKHVLLITAAATALAACDTGQNFQPSFVPATPKPVYVRLPYHFQLEKFVDNRPQSTLQQLAEKAAGVNQLDTQRFAQNLVKNMNRDLFGQNPAMVHITLNNTAIAHDSNYFLAAEVAMKVFNHTGTQLAGGIFHCTETKKQPPAPIRIIQNVIDGIAQTNAARNADIWAKLTDACAKTLALELNSAVLSQTTQTPVVAADNPTQQKGDTE